MSLRKALLTLCPPIVIAGVFACATSAQAQTAPADPVPNAQPDDAGSEGGPSFSFNAGIASDYVFRGVSQTEEDPQVFAGVDFTNDLTGGQLYAGAWASNVSFPGDPDTNAEIDLYAGFRPEAFGFNFDLGVIAYLYTGQPDGADYDYVEAKLSASRAVGPATLGAALYYSPDFFGAAEDEAVYVEVNGAYALTDQLSLSGAVGRQAVSSDFDYTTVNVGLAYTFADRFTLDGRYHSTDESDFGAIYDDRFVASLKAVF